VQFGGFSPILRTHTTKNPDSERRIWAYPEPYSAVLRTAFQLRYALQPYLYTEARRTYDTGVAFFRPLYYDWPEQDAAYTSKGEYIFGSQMVAAPVVSPVDKVSGLATEQVWIPDGEWLEWPTGKHFTGPTLVNRSFSIDQVPVYVRPGAIVPMQPPMLYTGQKPVDPLIVNIWPLAPGASSNYAVYEDSGASVEYQRGVFTRLPISAQQTADTLRVEIGPVEGSFPGMLKNRSYELRLPADWPPASVTVNGKPLPQGGVAKAGWTFVGNSLTSVIPTASMSVASRVVIEVRRQTGLTARRPELDGFAGAMTRLRATYDALQNTSPIAVPPDLLIDAMQTGDRLTYHPENAVAEIAHFHSVLPQAQAAIHSMAPTFKTGIEAYVRDASRDSKKRVDLDVRVQKRVDLMKRAEETVDAAAQ
jgi:alpha-glucosidase